MTEQQRIGVDRGYWIEAAEIKAHPATELQKVGTQTVAKPPATDVASLTSAYIRNEIAYACIEVKRSALQDPRLIVEERQRDGSYAEVPGHPLRRLWMRPHDDFDEASFLGLANASMDIAGWFIAEKVRSASGALVGLNPLNPALLRPYKDRQGAMLGYTWKLGGTQVDFLYEDLLIRTQPGWAGAAPLAVALGAIDADTAQTDFIRAFFRNGAQPGGILKVKGRIDPERAELLQSKWQQKYGRSGDGQHRPAVLDDDAEYQKVGSNLDELDSESVRSLTESRICMAFGVPPLIVYAYVGLLRATYSNLKEAWANFWDSKLSPDLKAWRAWLTWNLLVEFEGEERVYNEDVRLRWDLSSVAALQEDVDAAAVRIREDFKAGIATLNEARAVRGLIPDAAGNYYLRSMALVPTPTGMDAADMALDLAPAQSAQGPAPREVKRVPRSTERRLRETVAAYLASEYERAATAVLTRA